MLIAGGVVFASCNNSGSAATEATTDTTVMAANTLKMDYPYTIDQPDNWETGSQQNTLNVLNSLKAWENKDMDASLKYFADSVHIRLDGIDKMISNDTLKAMLTPPSTTKNSSIKMQDWESVISKDKKQEYVTLWYREYMENTKGEKDSMDVVNDLKMKDGKIIGLDQYIRKLH
jgi:multidrug efflux pump subunit AcrB